MPVSNSKSVSTQAPGLPAATSNFYLAMRILPREQREAMYAVYAFCRAVDDVADDRVGSRSERRAELDRWRSDIAALYAGNAPARVAAGITSTEPHTVLDSPALALVCDFIAAEAERHFAEANAIIAKAPRATTIAPQLMRDVYHLILEKLKARGWRAPRLHVRTPK